MKYVELARVGLFYVVIASVVLFSAPLGPYTSYSLIIALSLLFMAMSGTGLRLGSPAPGSAAGILAISAVFLVMIASGAALIAGAGSDFVGVLSFGLVLQLFVACGEELAFRGYIFADLRRVAGPGPAFVLSSVGFALLHLPSMTSFGVSPVSTAIALVTISLAGVLLAFLYEKSGLLSAIGFHFCWNFLQYHVFGLGLRSDMPSLVRLTDAGNALLTGGSYGPEASLPGLAVVIVTLGTAWLYYRHKADKLLAPQG